MIMDGYPPPPSQFQNNNGPEIEPSNRDMKSAEVHNFFQTETQLNGSMAAMSISTSNVQGYHNFLAKEGRQPFVGNDVSVPQQFREIPTPKPHMVPMMSVDSNVHNSNSAGLHLKSDFQSLNNQSNKMQTSANFPVSTANVFHEEPTGLPNRRELQTSSNDIQLSKPRVNHQLPAHVMPVIPKMQTIPTGESLQGTSSADGTRYVPSTISSFPQQSFMLQNEETSQHSQPSSTAAPSKQMQIPQASDSTNQVPSAHSGSQTQLRQMSQQSEFPQRSSAQADGLQQTGMQHQNPSANLPFQHTEMGPMPTSSHPFSQQNPFRNEGINHSHPEQTLNNNDGTLKMPPSSAYPPVQHEPIKPYQQNNSSYLSSQHGDHLRQSHQSPPGLSPQHPSDVLDSTKQVPGAHSTSQAQLRQMSQQPQFSRTSSQLPQQPQQLGAFSQQQFQNYAGNPAVQHNSPPAGFPPLPPQQQKPLPQQQTFQNYPGNPAVQHNSPPAGFPPLPPQQQNPLQQQQFQNHLGNSTMQHNSPPAGFPPLPPQQQNRIPSSFHQNYQTNPPPPALSSMPQPPSQTYPQHPPPSSNVNNQYVAPPYEHQQSLYREPQLQPSIGGYPAQHPSYERTGFQPQSPTQQIRKLDPDLMPSPIQMMQDDKQQRNGEIFETGKLDVVPPLVSTPFIVQDTGNSSPRYIRSTIYSIPTVPDMLKQASIPFGLVITPLAKILEPERPALVVNMGPEGPTRCVRCKAYMSPLMQFIDGGRRFHCPFCKGCTEVPETYFQHLDHTGMRTDRFERPELLLGTYEFVVPKEYCRNEKLPHSAGLLFMIDVTYASIKSRMVNVFCQEIRNLLKLLPVDQTTGKSVCRVAFMTYNDTIQFYNLNPILGRPQMLSVSDISEVFVPFNEGLFCDPIESDANIECLMEEIPQIFGNTKITDSLLAPAVQAGLQAFQNHEYVGKIFVFHSTLPNLKCQGKLEFRDERKLLGSEKEKHALAPQISDYTNLGKECVANGVAVDMFICNTGFVDLPTIGELCRVTGGEVYKYTYFDENIDGQRLVQDLHHNLTRETVYDAVLRVRTSTGIRPINYYGDFHFEVSSEISLATMNSEKAVAVELAHDDKLLEGEPVYIQVALLYTSLTGERRVRILNMIFNTCSQFADVFRNCELDTIMNYYSKMAIKKLSDSTPRQVKDALTARCAQLLACYRKTCATQSSSPGQLILPECMKLLPLYTNCLLKCDAVAGGPDMTVDDRWLMMHFLANANILSSVVYFYPRILPLVNIDVNSPELPTPVRCTLVKLASNEAYILENGFYLFIRIGSQVSIDWLKNVFGVNRVTDINLEHQRILPPLFDNPQSNKFHSILQRIALERHRSMKITILVENEGLDVVFKHYLVEDGIPGAGFEGYAVSYIDFLCFMHREVRSLTG